mmetsp:Transcript_125455/g.234611  ORF Transcript_125455/g.234611 Transcript_125455/m.234611 type:complete len:122 (+) Transcript_125455:169-534(+)
MPLAMVVVSSKAFQSDDKTVSSDCHALSPEIRKANPMLVEAMANILLRVSVVIRGEVMNVATKPSTMQLAVAMVIVTVAMLTKAMVAMPIQAMMAKVTLVFLLYLPDSYRRSPRMWSRVST